MKILVSSSGNLMGVPCGVICGSVCGPFGCTGKCVNICGLYCINACGEDCHAEWCGRLYN